MYNRYIPQPDGTYRRNRVQEPIHHEHPTPPPTPQPSPPCRDEPAEPPRQPPAPAPCRRPFPNSRQRQGVPQRHEPQRESLSIGSFFKKLLPKEFDTGDLMIILLLLLMSGDCPEDQNTALLTLVLYFFM